MWPAYLGSVGRIGLVEKGPDFGFDPLPPIEPAFVVVFLVAESACYFLLARFVRLDIQLV